MQVINVVVYEAHLGLILSDLFLSILHRAGRHWLKFQTRHSTYELAATQYQSRGPIHKIHLEASCSSTLSWTRLSVPSRTLSKLQRFT